jgi:hypothetical protein
VDPLVAVLALVLMTATVATLFSVVKRKGEGAGQALFGIVLGWALFLSPILFFGPVGAVIGIVMVMVVGGLVSVLGRRYDKRMRR